MKIFNKEINSCGMCPYYVIEPGVCSYTIIEIEDEDVIPNDCPFNKSITKDDIESLGFDSTLSFNYFEKVTEKDLFTLTINKDGTYSLENKKFLSFPMFDHITITSKPHLEFIFQSLNII